MGHIEAPGKTILDSYLWDVKHKLCPPKTCPPSSVRGYALGGLVGASAGKRTIMYEIIKTLELV